jgi:hypothetical protein
MRRPSLVALLLTLLFVSVALFAQVTFSSIFGTVTDTTGAVVPGVEVKVTQQETNFTRTAVADESGKYVLNALPLGTYRVEVSAPGFKTFSQTGIALEVSRNARVDPIMDVGGVTEVVEITADAPLVNTTDASVGRTVENKEILTLPLVNRDLYTLLTLTPGVDQADASNPLGSPAEISVVNGSSSGTGSIAYYLDGGNNTAGLRNTGNALPNPDAVQEFRVITNSYSAEFGRFSAGMVDVVTKSGANAIHGSVFEYLRNDALNANSWNSVTKPTLRRNQFGGTFGGPVVKDRTFYFGSYSGLRQHTTDSAKPVVPTALERVGNFSASSVKPNLPGTKTPFSNNTISPDQFDPTAKAILAAAIPLPNLPNNIFDSKAPHPNNINELQFKGDHQLNRAHMLTGSYYRNKGEDIEGMQTGSGGLPWSSRAFQWTQQNLNIGDNWNISPTTFNQLRLTYVRNFGGRNNSPAKTLADFGSKFQVQGTPALPQIGVTGFFTLGQAIAGPEAGSNYYGLRELFNWTKGKHAVKVGGEMSLEKNIHSALLNNYGVFSFDGSKTGNALADFLLGLPRTMNQDAPITKYNNGWYYSAFAQDDFRIHPRLVLNLGLRYDVQTPFTDPFDRQLTFVLGAQSKKVPTAPAGLLFPGDPGVTRGIVKTDSNNVAPRLGIAWDPMGDGKTSVRAAFGTFFGSISANEWNQTTDFQPFSARQQFNDVKSLTDPYGNLPGGVSPYPYVFSPTNTRFLANAAITAISPNFVWPYTYQMNLSVQRQLSRELSVTAAYVGALGHKWPTIRDVNYPVYGPGATAANVNDRRPIQPTPQAYSTISVIESEINNSYHGLQITAEKRTSHGVSFKGFYVFSKSLEGANEAAANGATGMQDATKMYLEKGRTNTDRRHVFVMSAIWDLKYYNGSTPVLSQVLKGWGLSTIIRARSGQPFTVSSGKDNNLDGVNNDRADLVGNALLDPHRSRADVTAAWFNTAAFKSNAAGQPGTSGRNILDKPGTRTVDLGLMRTFKLGERLEMQFKAEATNAFNIVNLSGPNTTFSSSAFGTINSADAMRQLQLGMRFAF